MAVNLSSLGGGDGTPVATAENAATANFILRPGAAFTTTAT